MVNVDVAKHPSGEQHALMERFFQGRHGEGPWWRRRP